MSTTHDGRPGDALSDRQDPGLVDAEWDEWFAQFLLRHPPRPKRGFFARLRVYVKWRLRQMPFKEAGNPVAHLRNKQ